MCNALQLVGQSQLYFLSDKGNAFFGSDPFDGGLAEANSEFEATFDNAFASGDAFTSGEDPFKSNGSNFDEAMGGLSMDDTEGARKSKSKEGAKRSKSKSRKPGGWK